MAEADVRQVGRVMAALAALREAEQRLAEASQRYMKLNRNDMRALHYLIAAKNRGVIATPGAIAEHLGISTASTTKLLDRLERGGHVTREPHPTDRRALAIAITPETHEAAVATVGRQHAKRFHACPPRRRHRRPPRRAPGRRPHGGPAARQALPRPRAPPARGARGGDPLPGGADRRHRQRRGGVGAARGPTRPPLTEPVRSSRASAQRRPVAEPVAVS